MAKLPLWLETRNLQYTNGAPFLFRIQTQKRKSKENKSKRKEKNNEQN